MCETHYFGESDWVEIGHRWEDWPVNKGYWDAQMNGELSKYLTWPRFNPQGVGACRCGCGDHGPWDLRLRCAIPALGRHGVGRVDSGNSLCCSSGSGWQDFPVTGNWKHRNRFLTLETWEVCVPFLAILSCCHPLVGLVLCWMEQPHVGALLRRYDAMSFWSPPSISRAFPYFPYFLRSTVAHPESI